MSVIDELYENRDENELVLKLEEKYENLKEFNTIKEIDLPDELQGISSSLPGIRLSLVELFKRSKMGWHSCR